MNRLILALSVPKPKTSGGLVQRPTPMVFASSTPRQGCRVPEAKNLPSMLGRNQSADTLTCYRATQVVYLGNYYSSVVAVGMTASDGLK